MKTANRFALLGLGLLALGLVINPLTATGQAIGAVVQRARQRMEARKAEIFVGPTIGSIAMRADQATGKLQAQSISRLAAYKDTGKVPNVVNLARKTPATPARTTPSRAPA